MASKVNGRSRAVKTGPLGRRELHAELTRDYLCVLFIFIKYCGLCNSLEVADYKINS